MEAQRERALDLAEEYGGVAVVDLDHPGELEEVVQRELETRANGYIRPLPEPGQPEIARVLLEELQQVERRRTGRGRLRPPAFVAVRPPPFDIRSRLPIVHRICNTQAAFGARTLLETDDLVTWSPQRLRERGAELVFGATEEPVRFEEWCRNHSPETMGLLAVGLERVRGNDDAPSRVLHRIERAAHASAIPAVVLDLTRERDPERAARLVRETAARVTASGCRLLSVEELASRVVEQRHLRPVP
jgi:hypothetical protein